MGNDTTKASPGEEATDYSLGALTLGGKMKLNWDERVEMSTNAHHVLFSEFLEAGGAFERFVEECPLVYTSNNAPEGNPNLPDGYEWYVLVTDLDLGAAEVAALYRQRGDCENIFDEMKNQGRVCVAVEPRGPLAGHRALRVPPVRLRKARIPALDRRPVHAEPLKGRANGRILLPPASSPPGRGLRQHCATLSLKSESGGRHQGQPHARRKRKTATSAVVRRPSYEAQLLFLG